MKRIIWISLSAIILLTAMVLAVFSPTTQVKAAAQADPTRTPKAGQQANQELAFTLQREQNWLGRQQLHLNQADQISTKAQNLIQKAQSKGIDVTDLNNALAAFNKQIAAAKTYHDQAASILSAKKGFDSNGKVTDPQAAHQTVLDARNALRQAHLDLSNAVVNLRLAIQNYRTNHGVK